MQEDRLLGLDGHGQVHQHLARRVEHRQAEALGRRVELRLQRRAADPRRDAANRVADQHPLQRGSHDRGLALAKAGDSRIDQLVDAGRPLAAHAGERGGEIVAVDALGERCLVTLLPQVGGHGEQSAARGYGVVAAMLPDLLVVPWRPVTGAVARLFAEPREAEGDQRQLGGRFGASR